MDKLKNLIDQTYDISKVILFDNLNIIVLYQYGYNTGTIGEELFDNNTLHRYITYEKYRTNDQRDIFENFEFMNYMAEIVVTGKSILRDELLLDYDTEVLDIIKSSLNILDYINMIKQLIDLRDLKLYSKTYKMMNDIDLQMIKYIILSMNKEQINELLNILKHPNIDTVFTPRHILFINSLINNN